MSDASLRAGRVLMVGHLLQYHPAYIKLKQLVADGAIGQLRYVYSNRLSMGKIRTEEDVVWSFAPHDISMVLGLSNEAPDDVSCHGARLVSEHVSDSAHLHLSFPSGLRAHIFTSWLSPHKEQRLVAIGEIGSLVFDDVKPWNEKLVLTRHGLESGPVLVKGEVSPIDVEQAEPLKEECAHFLDAIRANKPPRTDAEEALAVLDVLMRADEAVAHAGDQKK
jgi:UDP-2-acetamido-3-amino-2,3-dideoxy-glucuronate N-acetyltransferase